MPKGKSITKIPLSDEDLSINRKSSQVSFIENQYSENVNREKRISTVNCSY